MGISKNDSVEPKSLIITRAALCWSLTTYQALYACITNILLSSHTAAETEGQGAQGHTKQSQNVNSNLSDSNSKVSVIFRMLYVIFIPNNWLEVFQYNSCLPPNVHVSLSEHPLEWTTSWAKKTRRWAEVRVLLLELLIWVVWEVIVFITDLQGVWLAMLKIQNRSQDMPGHQLRSGQSKKASCKLGLLEQERTAAGEPQKQLLKRGAWAETPPCCISGTSWSLESGERAAVPIQKPLKSRFCLRNLYPDPHAAGFHCWHPGAPCSSSPCYPQGNPHTSDFFHLLTSTPICGPSDMTQSFHSTTLPSLHVHSTVPISVRLYLLFCSFC